MSNVTGDIELQRVKALTRRHFFGNAGLGVGAMALSALDTKSTSAAPAASSAWHNLVLSGADMMMPMPVYPYPDRFAATMSSGISPI